MAATALDTVVTFLYQCSREEIRSPLQKAAMVAMFTEDMMAMVARLVTAKKRRAWKQGSRISKMHAARLLEERKVRPIKYESDLEVAITEASIYHALSDPIHRSFLLKIFFGQSVCWIGAAWIRRYCPNPGEYLFPQPIPNAEIIDLMRPTSITTIEEVPERAIAQVKYDGRRVLMFIYKFVIMLLSRGGTVTWASRDVLADRYSGRELPAPENPGKLLYILDGELVATRGHERLPATDSVGVGTIKPGVCVVFDCLYARRFKHGGKQYRNDDYAHLYAFPLSARLSIAEMVVRQYTGDAYYSDAKLSSLGFLWLAETVPISDLEAVMATEEGVVIKDPNAAYSSIRGPHDTPSTKWFKFKQRTESLDVRIVRGRWLPSDPSTPGSLEMLLRGADDEYVSIKNVSALSAEDVEYLVGVGITVTPQGFDLDRPVYAEVLVDYKDGVFRHPRIVRFREEDEGFTVSSIADIC